MKCLFIVLAVFCSLSFAAVNLPAPYVHQVFDTPDWFNGAWACGPTSAVMAAAALGHLTPHPIEISVPYKHKNDYGYYVPSKFTAYGTTFNQTQKDASGKPAWGAYGACTQDGLAWAMRIVNFLQKLKLHATFHDSPTHNQVKSILDKKHYIILSTQLTNAGHLILVRGYDKDGKLICNDPWGDANQANYGKSMNGAGVHYTWAKVKAKWMVEVWA